MDGSCRGAGYRGFLTLRERYWKQLDPQQQAEAIRRGEIDGSHFYDPRFWDPELYQAWHDAVWMEPRTGNVDIGDIEALKQGESPDHD